MSYIVFNESTGRFTTTRLDPSYESYMPHSEWIKDGDYYYPHGPFIPVEESPVLHHVIYNPDHGVVERRSDTFWKWDLFEEAHPETRRRSPKKKPREEVLLLTYEPSCEVKVTWEQLCAECDLSWTLGCPDLPPLIESYEDITAWIDATNLYSFNKNK